MMAPCGPSAWAQLATQLLSSVMLLMPYGYLLMMWLAMHCQSFLQVISTRLIQSTLLLLWFWHPIKQNSIKLLGNGWNFWIWWVGILILLLPRFLLFLFLFLILILLLLSMSLPAAPVSVRLLPSSPSPWTSPQPRGWDTASGKDYPNKFKPSKPNRLFDMRLLRHLLLLKLIINWLDDVSQVKFCSLSSQIISTMNIV